MLYAFCTVTLCADQVVTGMAINILAPAIALFGYNLFVGSNSANATGAQMPSIAIPGLSDIPFIGNAFFNQTLLAYLAFILVPLVRYYANHANELPSPFKALQIGSVWRADRPQRGRYRQFTQCDIDILGDASYIAEIELILATTTVLGRLDFHNFTIRINDRKILKDMAKKAGFAESDYEKVFIILDKMDKIGLDGVREELLASYPAETVDAYLAQFDDTQDPAALMEGSPLPEIIRTVDAVKTADFRIQFDPTLVRGMSYYTGPIFEIAMDEYGGSVGGGGRYDEMIGKFTGQQTPAVGFSIGFERIIMLLLERGFTVPDAERKVAFLIEKKMPAEKLVEVFSEARKERENGSAVAISVMKKNKKFQKDQLAAEGYTEIREFFAR